MKIGDKILNGIMKIEKIKAEVIACEVMLLEDKFDSEEMEDQIRMNRVVLMGNVEVIKTRLKPLVNKYLN